MKKLSTPRYCLHKATGQGYVKLNGKPVYLGKYDKPESRQKYHRIVNEWEHNGRVPVVPADDIRILDLIEQYFLWAKSYYRKPDGSPTSRLITIKSALRPFKELYGYSPIAEFSPSQLKVVRQKYIDNGMVRKSVNDYTGIIKHCFKWGVEEGLVPHPVFGALHVVAGLRKGRSEAPDGKLITPVDENTVEATMKYLPTQLQALIRLQLLTGARPGELIDLRCIDFDTSSEVWTVKPTHHKTAHHGLDRIIHFGTKAQKIIKPFMKGRPIHMPLFSPKEARNEHSAKATSHRRPNQYPTPTSTPRTIGDAYTVDSYRRAIHRACDKAGVEQWSPNRLRHTAATQIRADFGLEATQVIMGHAKADVTQVYAERDTALAVKVIGIIG